MRKQGFAVASPTIVADGMLERILEKLEDDCQLYADGKLYLTGGSVGALGFSAGIQLERDAATTKSPNSDSCNCAASSLPKIAGSHPDR